MGQTEDSDTRYFIDLDLDTQTILGWDFGQRYDLAVELKNPYHHRVFISKGQFHKLGRKNREVENRAARNG